MDHAPPCSKEYGQEFVGFGGAANEKVGMDRRVGQFIQQNWPGGSAGG